VPLPISLSWNLTSSIAISPTTINQTVQVVDLSAGLPVVTLPVAAVAGQSAYSFTLTLAELLSGNYTGNLTNPALLPDDIYQIGVVATGNSSTVGVRTATAVTHGFIVAVAPSGSVSATQTAFGNIGNGIANVTITAVYTGSYLLSANVTVTTSSGAVAFSAGVLQNCPTTPGSPTVCTRTVSVTWVPGSGGMYSITMTLRNAANQTATANGTASVNATGSATVTTQHWTNSTLISGLNPGAAAAILLVVGLIIGLLVALVLGRSMWASPKATPAQPWQQTTTTTAGTHECSVCHQTFPTEEELQEHAKTAHGMT
ncbi:MAG: C2H2-type zinc finger protein, partial [Thermoplasmata archaeon]